ncbi:hypothetical protein [Streptomyces prunicolor]|uniref:hypothetical protein n=1 Tax=Streptomyces prunicolor TaxID=67348 RepID=UPI00037AFCF4|nr:hypothetical protein [Streptomyces prunicolor]
MTTTTCPVPTAFQPGGVDDEHPAITRDDARLVLQHLGYTLPGIPDKTHTFRGRLVALIAEADTANRIALARSYPALVAAVRLTRCSPTGIDTLHAIATSTR